MVTDRKVYRFAAFGREYIQFYVAAVPINQGDVIFGKVTPYQGYPTSPYNLYGWQIANVQSFSTAVVATASCRIVVGAGASSTQTPNAGSVTQHSLGTLPKGKYTDTIDMRCTTDGTGTITNLLVTVTLRPYPLDGEAA